jgi:molybdopterin molybdotransferase
MALVGCGDTVTKSMLSVAAAQQEMMASAVSLGTESVHVMHAHRRVLSQPVLALRSLPAFDNSAMDGFGVRAIDVAAASDDQPVRLLKVAGNRADGGAASVGIGVGQCMPIMTGAPLSPGVDAVIMREHIREDGHGVLVSSTVVVGQHIRRVGEDIHAGAEVLPAGVRIHSAALNAVMASGVTTVDVHRRPRVIVFATGDELVEVGAAVGGHQVINSNLYAVCARLHEQGYAATVGGILADNVDDHQHRITAATIDHDVIVTIGGVSMGSHDFVRPALSACGFQLSLWQVAMRPGKPIAFAVHSEERRWAVGLPGNPVSSLVTTELFLLPLLRALEGDRSPLPRLVPARWRGATMTKKAGLALFARVSTTVIDHQLTCTAVAGQGSHQVKSMAQADALAWLDESKDVIQAGDPVLLLM